MSKTVTNGAQLRCTCGSAPAKLIIPSGTGKIDGNALATIEDFKPVGNIPPFGKCSKNNYKSCKPAIKDPWRCSNSVSIDGKPALTEDGMNKCVQGGVITIQDAGAKSVKAG